MAFLVVVVSSILFMLPVTSAVYDFQTDLRNDSFTVVTPDNTTNASVTLRMVLYNNDTDTIDILSASSEDTPMLYSYNGTTRELMMVGLADNLSRVVTVSYDVDALSGSDAISNLINKVPLIWLLCIIAFPITALVAIISGKI